MMYDTIWSPVQASSTTTQASHWQRPEFHVTGPVAPRTGHGFGSAPIQHSLSPRLQPKLTVSKAGDSAEREADSVAAAVMSMPESPSGAVARQDVAPEEATDEVRRKCTECAKDSAKPDEEAKDTSAKPDEEAKDPSAGTGDAMQRMADASTEDEDVKRAADDESIDVQRAADGEEEKAHRAEEDKDDGLAQRASGQTSAAPRVTPALEGKIRSIHAGGAPLAKETRDFFEPRFGTSFANVRVHTGSQEAGVARHLNAKAFTMGSHITFGEGHYQPASSGGKRLLAHELTHVVQQRGGR